MRPEFLRNDVDASLLRELKRILTEVPDIPAVLADPLVGLLDGSMDPNTAYLALRNGRSSALGSCPAVYRHVMELVGFFCPVHMEIRDQRPSPDRDYWDRRCRNYLAHIRALLNSRKFPDNKSR